MRANHDGERRRSEEAVRLDVPTLLGQQRVPCRGEARRVRNGCTTDERHTGRGRESEDVDEPL